VVSVEGALLSGRAAGHAAGAADSLHSGVPMAENKTKANDTSVDA
jgi:hypothetical protein